MGCWDVLRYTPIIVTASPAPSVLAHTVSPGFTLPTVGGAGYVQKRHVRTDCPADRGAWTRVEMTHILGNVYGRHCQTGPIYYTASTAWEPPSATCCHGRKLQTQTHSSPGRANTESVLCFQLPSGAVSPRVPEFLTDAPGSVQTALLG